MLPQRIAILADAHLGLHRLQSDGHTYGEVSSVLDRAISRIAQLELQQVVLLGDLVNRGYQDEYTRARRALEPIWNRCVPVLGNHELQRASIADFERNMNCRPFRISPVGGLPAIILNSGIEHLPDTEWQGELDHRQLEFLDDASSRLPPGPRLVFVHHPIAGTVRDSEQPMHGLVNSSEVESRLEPHRGPTVVFSAHTHSQSFARRGRFSYVGAPALGFWPHAFLVVDVGQRQMQFSTICLIDDPTESPDARALDAGYRAAREGESADRSGTIPLEH